MNEIVLVVAALAACWLSMRFMGSNVFGRGKTRADFNSAIQTLATLMGNGGVLRVRNRRSKVQFDIVRAGGSDFDADLELRIPPAMWAKRCERDLVDFFEARNFEVSIGAAGEAKRVAAVHIRVPDIWDKAAGARAAHGARALVDALSIPDDAKFDLALLGPRSTRILERETALRSTD